MIIKAGKALRYLFFFLVIPREGGGGGGLGNRKPNPIKKILQVFLQFQYFSVMYT